MQSEYGKSFDLLFRQLVERTCLEWGYPFPNEEYFNDIYSRLPAGIRRAISYGYERAAR